jgi:hypothetical protein
VQACARAHIVMSKADAAVLSVRTIINGLCGCNGIIERQAGRVNTPEVPA